jgi:hypothetical protein
MFGMARLIAGVSLSPYMVRNDIYWRISRNRLANRQATRRDERLARIDRFRPLQTAIFAHHMSG